MKLVAIWLLSITTVVHAQAPGKWPPDSLVNTQVIARTTSVTAVWGQMRNIAFSLGVECTYCHVGESGAALARIDFISDEKRTKLVARQMLRMVQEINRRIDTLPGRGRAGKFDDALQLLALNETLFPGSSACTSFAATFN